MKILKFNNFNECRVFNQTDGVYATHKKFKNEISAQKFIDKFRESFKSQGYYLTNKKEQIKPEEIELIIK